MAEPRFRLAGPRMFDLRQALLLTAASAALPGVAHLRAGRRRAGLLLLAGYAGVLGAVVFAVTGYHGDLVGLAVKPRLLIALMLVSVAVAVVWAILLVSSYLTVRPRRMPLPMRIMAGAAVVFMCAVAAVPPLTVARYSYLQQSLVSSVFPDEPAQPATPPQAGPPRVAVAPTPARAALPARLNILLIGGDADVTRPGLRTDSMTLASLNTRTGDTTLLSLPRNLQHVAVWDGRARVTAFPPKELLNAVYEYGLAHPRLTGGRNPGAELLKRTFGHIVGLPVDYYGMVDMRSFRQIVEAMHGVRVCVDKAVPVPREQVPAGVIRPGCQKLTGRQALWYGRSRTGSSDYSRMSRQKCLMWALAHQADPLTVLRSFQRLAKVFKSSVNTDIPQRLLPGLLALKSRMSAAKLSSVQFIPPTINTWMPDYARIRAVAARAIRTPASVRMAHQLGKTCT